MTNEKIYAMPFAKVYGLLIAKAERKGRTRENVDEIACWLTGYRRDELNHLMQSDLTYGDFFLKAPFLNPKRRLIRGVICGVRIEEMDESLMREIRYLDKLIDELAKGKPMEKILRA